MRPSLLLAAMVAAMVAVTEPVQSHRKVFASAHHPHAGVCMACAWRVHGVCIREFDLPPRLLRRRRRGGEYLMRAPRAGTRARTRRSSTLVCSPAPGLRWSGHTGRSAASPVALPAASPADPHATRARPATATRGPKDPPLWRRRRGGGGAELLVPRSTTFPITSRRSLGRATARSPTRPTSVWSPISSH